MKVIEIKLLDGLLEDFNSYKYSDEKFSEFVERTTDDGKIIWRNIK
tara:strand:+ start:6314 stop:6451 length:138 start_codon:yes stop_codon:yes gene_type:complete